MRRPSPLPRLLIALLALLSPLAAPAGAQSPYPSFGKNKIQYREFDWRIYRSPHFDVYHYTDDPAQLEKIVSFAESAYDRLSREFDFQIQKPTPLIFYETHSAFEQNNIIVNFIPEGVGAFASPVRNRMVLPVDLPDGELFALFLHELTHIFQFEILFQGRIGRGIGVPQWVMEGMASYMAKDEGTSDKMFLRDAVVNDRIPSILERGVSGFFAYRFGHAAFDFMEERWGKEGFRDFVYEFRNTLGGRVEKAVQRAFRIEPEDFDVEFRRWLRKQYLPQLVATGEPSDFGRRFRYEEGQRGETLSPAASPSGDLVAALSTVRSDVDVVLFDGRKRTPLANLTRGFSSDYQYLVSQFVTSGPRMGRDLAFSPDGNRLAAFAKRERGRSLVLLDVLKRKVDRVIDMEVEQQHGPAFSPDGRRVAFSGNRGGRFDIFTYDLESGEIANLTGDETYDGAPVFSPDGRSLVWSAVVAGEHAQLFRMDLASGERFRLTEGEWSDKDAVFSSDGGRIYFTSDRTGADNIWSLDLASGQLLQHTNAVTGCFMPAILPSPEGDRLVYTGFWRGQFDLYVADLGEPVGEAQVVTLPTEPTAPAELAAFEPDIRVSLDDANLTPYRGLKLFLEDGGAYIGVTDDQTVLGYTYLSFTDYLGDRRLVTAFSSIESFSNFDFVYTDLSRRLNWSLRLFDDRTFYIGLDQSRGVLERGRAAYSLTGAIGAIEYPFDFYRRFELGAGYIFREYDFQRVVYDPVTGTPVYSIEPQKDDFPIVQAAFVGDTTVFASWGPVSGRRYRVSAAYAPDLDESGTLTANFDLDWRQYVQVTERSNLSLRLFAGVAEGNLPSPYYFGGLNTLRGFDFRTLVGDRAWFANLEYRFPLVDILATPVLGFRGIRGRIFLDVGGVWWDFAGESFDFWDSDEKRLEDGLSAYGWGFTVRFGGVDLNWDFAQRWDFKDSIDDGFRTSFWIGTSF
ncbi:MAG: PD40 domain-containing protein [Thermoanaerobaculia bacterium]|nr:PD40 domain-containing protein [Thermoanaerobaculia bacterium]MCZ7653002.1 BamA/TamA family outer membrane protein [Thermoanaerobaculia bacterium]